MYPKNYGEERHCSYLILAPIGKAVVLDFVDFSMEDTSYPDCDFDVLQVSER